MKKYSASTGGFYDTGIHKTIPGDAVDVSDATYAALIDAQISGKVIVADVDGYPVADAGPAGVDLAFWLDHVVRPQRDDKMNAFDLRRVNKCRRQIDQGVTPDDDLQTLLAYQQTLADFPATLTAIVDPIPWPEEPV